MQSHFSPAFLCFHRQRTKIRAYVVLNITDRKGRLFEIQKFMEEQKNNKNGRMGNECATCQGKMCWSKCGRCLAGGGHCLAGGGHGHHIVKLILTILVLCFVFCLGAAFGRATARTRYNRGYMIPGGRSRVVPMMQGQWANPNANTAPATTTQK